MSLINVSKILKKSILKGDKQYGDLGEVDTR